MLRNVLKQNAAQIAPAPVPVAQQVHLPSQYSPKSWTGYFDRLMEVKPHEGLADTFGVYSACDPTADTSTVFLFLHGAGQSSLSWALVAVQPRTSYRAHIFQSILKQHVMCYAIDFRGHGSTKTDDDGDLSAERLCNDVVSIGKHLFVPLQETNKPPRVIIVGHSMGGAIAARVCDRIGALGLILVDIVEGTARASYPHIRAIIENRPSSFVSAASAIAWSLNSQMLRNAESACVSIPSQLVPQEAPDVGLRWRTPLAQSYKYWEGWYEGLSDVFIKCRAVKALILAGIERLDKTLTVGQIQGKFQLTILPVETGHSVQEDAPKHMADVLLSFYHRYATTRK